MTIVPGTEWLWLAEVWLCDGVEWLWDADVCEWDAWVTAGIPVSAAVNANPSMYNRAANKSPPSMVRVRSAPAASISIGTPASTLSVNVRRTAPVVVGVTVADV